MQVSFRKTHRQGYAVDIRREHGEDLTMNPAPGYDDLMPHDLVHLVVERHWRLRDGIYGQVDRGGNAGTFRLADERPAGETAREWRRKARRVPRGASGGGTDMARSEQLASVVHARWDQRQHGGLLPEWYERALAASGAEETEIVSALERAESLGRRWQRVEVGGSLVVSWP